VVASVFSCSPDENVELQSSNLKISNLTTLVTTNDLVGQWNLSQMQADTAVDLDKDGIAHTNLLLESSCFNTMDVNFKSDMTFTTHNSKLDFNGGATGDQLTCAQGRDDFGTWSVSNDTLTLNINVDGSVYTQKKKLTYNSTTFSFDVTKLESNQYVNDPGNTSASSIRILSLQYSKN
ncbi:MAG: DUF5004 domain-containing protein, partial [Gillisia sp.]